MSTSDPCLRVQEAIAAGQVLATEDARHAAECSACRGIARAARLAGDLMPGDSTELAREFRARFLAGGKARHRRRVRRGRTLAALGAAAAAGAIGLVIASRSEPIDKPEPSVATAQRQDTARIPEPSAEPAASEPLTGIEADVLGAALTTSVRWDYVDEPLNAYGLLADSVVPADHDSGGTP